MQSLFCKRCKSLNLPGAERCKTCRAPLGEESVSRQSSLYVREERPLCEIDEEELFCEPEEDEGLKTFVEEENAEAPYLPYVPRPGQLTIINEIKESLDGGCHIVMESGTGTGKTIVSLSAALAHAKANGKKVVYLTRTVSQSNQVMRELRAINRIKSVSGLPSPAGDDPVSFSAANPVTKRFRPTFFQSVRKQETRERRKLQLLLAYQRTYRHHMELLSYGISRIG